MNNMIVKRLELAEKMNKTYRKEIKELTKKLSIISTNYNRVCKSLEVANDIQFSILKVKETSIKFQINEIVFLWRRVMYQPYNTIEIVVVNDLGAYSLEAINVDDISKIQADPIQMNIKQGQTYKEITWKVREVIEQEVGVFKLYNVAKQQLSKGNKGEQE